MRLRVSLEYCKRISHVFQWNVFYSIFFRINAPATLNQKENEELNQEQGVLGAVPHSIRGFLHSYQTVLPTCSKFKQCIACSNIVIDKYIKEGIEFLFKVFNSGTYLEEITGLSELQLSAEMIDVSMKLVKSITSKFISLC